MTHPGTAALLLLASCSILRPLGGERAEGAAKSAPPDRVTLVKLISWAEPGADPCETDLEGSVPPAAFRLKYRETGHDPVTIENDPELLFAAGWGIVTRSARGLGFEKAGAFESLDFDIVEELQCKCRDDRRNALVRVNVDWRAGEKPRVRGRLEDGRAHAVEAVTMNGRLALYEFRFARALPGGMHGECASRFLLALVLDRPIE